MKRLLFFILAIAFLWSAPFATTYYVKTTGNDGNAGTGTGDGEAWLTIGQANSTLAFGDIVYVMAGTYNETINPANDGTSGNVITYENYQTDTVILRPVSGVTRGAYITKDYITIDGFEISEASAPGTYMTQGVLITSSAHHVIVENCTIKNTRVGSYDGVAIYNGCEYIQILDNTISYCGNYTTQTGEGIKIYDISDGSGGRVCTTQYVLIEGNTISYCGHMCITVSGLYTIVRDNNIHAPWETGIDTQGDYPTATYGYNHYVVIDDNKIWGSGDSADNHPGDLKVLGIQIHSKGNIIRRNRFYENEASGISMWGNVGRHASYGHIFHNVFYNNGINVTNATAKMGLRFQDQGDGGYVDNGVVKNNIFYQNETDNISYVNCAAGDMTLADNYFESDGNPLFNDAPNDDFEIPSNSPCVGAGAWLTLTNGTGNASQTLIVDDAMFFCDGHNITTGDTIQLQGQTTTAVITAINYGTHTLTIDTALTWTDGLGVALDYEGSNPDIGWYEYVPLGGGSDQVDWPNIYIDASAGAGGVGSQADPYDEFSDINWTTGGDNSVFDYYAGSPATSVILWLKQGEEWREQLTIGHAGTATYPLLVQEYGSGAAPIINGSELVATWEKTWQTTNLVDNPGFETAGGGGADVFANWVETTAGTSTVNDEGVEVHGGNHACRLDVDATPSAVSVYEAVTLTASTEYKITFWGWTSTGGDAKSILKDTGGNVSLESDGTWGAGAWNIWVLFSDNSYTEHSLVFTSHASYTDYRAYAFRESASLSAYYDDFSIYQRRANVWQAACTTEPNSIWLDGTAGNKQTAIADVDSANDWYWTANVLYVYSATDPDSAFSSPGVESGTRDFGIRFDSKDYVTIDGITATRTNAAAFSGVSSTGFVIQNCTATGTSGWGVAIQGAPGDVDSGSILDNTLHDSDAHGGIFIGTSPNGPTGITVQGNTIYNSDSHGIYLNYANTNIIRYNVIYDNTQHGISLQNEADSNQVYYNLVYTNTGKGITLPGTAGGGGSNSNLIYNNMIYNNTDYGLSIVPGSDNNIFKNNIIQHDNLTYNRPIYIASQEIVDNTFDNNRYYFDSVEVGLDGQVAVVDSVGKTLAEWQALTGTPDGNSTHGDPLMTDPGSDDFTLQVGSPCINMGTHIALFVDYLGLPVPIGHRPDIGAYEHKNGGTIF